MTDPQSFEIFQSVEIFHSWDLYDNIVGNNHDAIKHIRNYDFPEQESWMIDTWESNPQNQRSAGNPIEYRDEFYVALRLAAG